MPYIRVLTGKNADQVYEIKDDIITFGRDASETIQVLDQGVSRQHSEIFRIGELYFIRDLDSKNGTFLNDEPITEQALQVGDKLRIGQTVFVFEDDVDPEAQQMVNKVQFEKGDAPPSSTIELSFTKDQISEVGGQSAKNLSLLFKVSKILGNTHNLKSIYENVLKLAIEAVNADNGYIFECGKKGTLVPAMVVEKDSDSSAKVSKTIISRVIEHEKALLTADAAIDPRFSAKQSIVMRKTSSVICAPLIALETLNGVIYLSASRYNKTFTSEDLELMSVVAIQLGMVLQTVKTLKKEKEQLISTIRTLVGIKEQRHPKRKGHSSRVAAYSAAIGKEMKLLPEQNYYLQFAAWLHDIGHIASDKDPFEQARDEEERKHKQAEYIKTTRKIVATIGLDQEVLDAVSHHTERFDGSGFPDGKVGPDIPLFARIIAVAKEFDLMCSYGGDEGKGMPVKDVLVAVNKLAAKQFDPEVVQALLVAYRKGGLGKSGKSE